MWHPISIVLIIRSLETGGAEVQMVQLATALRQLGHQVRVAVFYRRGPLEAELAEQGIEIIDLEKAGRWDVTGFLRRTIHALQEAQPDIVYSFLGGANIVAAVATRFIPKTKLIWSVRASYVDLALYDWTHRLAYRIERSLAKVPDAIIANSKSGQSFAVANGFPEDKIVIVHNGIDTDKFCADRAVRRRQRQEWGLSESLTVVGTLGRLDPMKDQQTFLRAAALLAPKHPQLRFVCAGEGPERHRLAALTQDLCLTDRVFLVGQAEPVAALNAFDVACSSSIAEGFPNVVAEAMAVGTPCVVTAVGDSLSVVGEYGTAVKPQNPEALAAGILEELSVTGNERKKAQRRRVLTNFSRRAMVDATLKAFEATIGPE